MTLADISGCLCSAAGAVGGALLGLQYGLFCGGLGLVVGFVGGGLAGMSLIPLGAALLGRGRPGTMGAGRAGAGQDPREREPPPDP